MQSQNQQGAVSTRRTEFLSLVLIHVEWSDTTHQNNVFNCSYRVYGESDIWSILNICMRTVWAVQDFYRQKNGTIVTRQTPIPMLLSSASCIIVELFMYHTLHSADWIQKVWQCSDSYLFAQSLLCFSVGHSWFLLHLHWRSVATAAPVAQGWIWAGVICVGLLSLPAILRVQISPVQTCVGRRLPMHTSSMPISAGPICQERR